MKYLIQIIYSSGDTFGTEDGIVRDLDGYWEDEDIVEENVRRIYEHYAYYQAIHETFTRNPKERQLVKEVIRQATEKSWYVPGNDSSLKLILDDSKEYQIGAFWCGYFENLDDVNVYIETPKRFRKT